MNESIAEQGGITIYTQDDKIMTKQTIRDLVSYYLIVDR